MDRCSICFFFFFIACLCLYAVPRIRQLASKSMNVPNGKAVAAQAAISPALYSLARNLVGNLSVRSLFTVECHLFFSIFHYHRLPECVCMWCGCDSQII